MGIGEFQVRGLLRSRVKGTGIASLVLFNAFSIIFCWSSAPSITYKRRLGFLVFFRRCDWSLLFLILFLLLSLDNLYRVWLLGLIGEFFLSLIQVPFSRRRSFPVCVWMYGFVKLRFLFSFMLSGRGSSGFNILWTLLLKISHIAINEELFGVPFLLLRVWNIFPPNIGIIAILNWVSIDALDERSCYTGSWLTWGLNFAL